MKTLVLILTLLLLSGCNSDNRNSHPYIMNQKSNSTKGESEKVRLMKMDSENKKDIAEIQMKQAIEVAKIHQVAEVEKATINKDVALVKNETELIKEDNTFNIQKWLLILVGILTSIIAFYIFFNAQKNRKSKVQMHQDDLEQQRILKEQEMRYHMAEKMLDTLSSGKLSQDQEAKLIDTFSQTANPSDIKVIEK